MDQSQDQPGYTLQLRTHGLDLGDLHKQHTCVGQCSPLGGVENELKSQKTDLHLVVPRGCDFSGYSRTADKSSYEQEAYEGGAR